MAPILQASQHAPAPAGLPSWSDIAGPAGGFIAAVVLIVLGGKGFYRLAMYGIDAARGFGGAMVTEWRRSNDEMRGWLASHAVEEIAVMREIRDSLNRAAVERERHTAEIKAAIEQAAKETRHRVSNDLQVLASRFEDCPGFQSDPPPAARDDREHDVAHIGRGREREREPR